ncbi:hypothetical protein T265_07024 [Opisthorchis viverrini]|uniref:Uncharacterized protein n=1 Tax=Opisthorchis viverrini TaxID=6198 RepID=A0A074ZQF6_OPIVI|nr:hypothetical protein T265_07024 [Opisthorchis viverrini]KER25565.1 hypothetical protein T265_07024 [Opisthorchis viverrini]
MGAQTKDRLHGRPAGLSTIILTIAKVATTVTIRGGGKHYRVNSQAGSVTKFDRQTAFPTNGTQQPVVHQVWPDPSLAVFVDVALDGLEILACEKHKFD